MNRIHHDTVAILAETIHRQREALHAIDQKVQSIRGQGDPNVRRTLEAIDRIIEEAL